MAKAAPELVVIEKTHELLVWTLKHIPRLSSAVCRPPSVNRRLFIAVC